MRDYHHQNDRIKEVSAAFERVPVDVWGGGGSGLEAEFAGGIVSTQCLQPRI